MADIIVDENFTFRLTQIDLIPQEIKELYPEVVNYYEKENLYHVKYAELNVMAIKAIQDQQKPIKAQAKVIEDKDGRITRLEKMIMELKESKLIEKG
jgi:hypothetical protein